MKNYKPSPSSSSFFLHSFPIFFSQETPMLLVARKKFCRRFCRHLHKENSFYFTQFLRLVNSTVELKEKMWKVCQNAELVMKKCVKQCWKGVHWVTGKWRFWRPSFLFTFYALLKFKKILFANPLTGFFLHTST